MKKSAWYVFADGYEGWLCGMSRQEQRVLESKHGKIVEIYYDQTERRKPGGDKNHRLIFLNYLKIQNIHTTLRM